MRLPVLFILITVMLDAMGIGLIVPVMPDLIREIQGGTLAGAALWGGVLSTVFAVMQFLFSPLLGNLSDRFGRRPVLLISLAVMTLDYLVMAVAGSIWLLLAGRLVGGITAATHGTASAYMADISAARDKAANFGLIGAGFGIGFVLGPLIGGTLGEFGTRAPFYAAAALAALNTAFGYFILRETVTDQIRRPFLWSRANPLGAFRSVARLPAIGNLLWVYFIYSVAFHVYPAVWSFFTMERFGWSPQTVGLSLALFGIMMALVQGGLIRLVLRWLGEWRTVVYGHLFDTVAFGLIAIVTSSTLALAMIVSPLMMTSVFAAFTRPGAAVYFPGAPFIVSLLLMLLSLALFLRSRPPAA
ncbi:MFS transporter [Sedimentitalea nanhaiensis]|uniref:MFS transporter n=1 Tax=Sedimentitalea nanhaiensis TaxID=999627 RepID=UPI001FE1E0F2|nr:MFS transporter [Sedimentitalea nanhaiensis]